MYHPSEGWKKKTQQKQVVVFLYPFFRGGIFVGPFLELLTPTKNWCVCLPTLHVGLHSRAVKTPMKTALPASLSCSPSLSK